MYLQTPSFTRRNETRQTLLHRLSAREDQGRVIRVQEVSNAQLTSSSSSSSSGSSTVLVDLLTQGEL